MSPTVKTLTELLHLLGEDLVLDVTAQDTGIDLTLNRGNLELAPEQRIEKGLEFAEFVRRNRREPGPLGD